MKNRRWMFYALCMGAAGVVQAVSVTDVTAHPRWPWRAHVDVDVTLSQTEEGATYLVTLEATQPAWTGAAVSARTFLTKPLVSGNGPHRLVWDLGTDCPGLSVSNLQVRATVTPFAPHDPLYMVIDLSGGPQASSYPVRYSRTPPENILSNDLCRTDELWLRRCPAGTFTMGEGTTLRGSNNDNAHLPAHTVKLTKPFWIAIFETTQQQWAHVMGTWPSAFTNKACRATRPVDQVRRYDIRGNDGWFNTPVSTVHEISFCGFLRTRTGLATLDLPTEAQWEYACRAGTTGRYYWPAMTASTIAQWGRCATGGMNLMLPGTTDQPDLSVDTSYGSARVGTYSANPWGLYDMLGNLMDVVGDGNPFHADQDYADVYVNAYTNAVRVDPRGPPAIPSVDGFDEKSVTTVTGRGGDITMQPQRLHAVYRRYLSSSTKARQWTFRIAVTDE